MDHILQQTNYSGQDNFLSFWTEDYVSTDTSRGTYPYTLCKMWLHKVEP